MSESGTVQWLVSAAAVGFATLGYYFWKTPKQQDVANSQK
jgi:hypothetical protein